MNTDDIEKDLNNFEADPNKVLALVLKTVVNNQALLETILDIQVGLISVASKTEIAIVKKDVRAMFETYLAKAQADISSQF